MNFTVKAKVNGITGILALEFSDYRSSARIEIPLKEMLTTTVTKQIDTYPSAKTKRELQDSPGHPDAAIQKVEGDAEVTTAEGILPEEIPISSPEPIVTESIEPIEIPLISFPLQK